MQGFRRILVGISRLGCLAGLLFLCVGPADAQQHTPVPQTLAFAYWVSDSTLQTVIILNNTTEHAISVTPTLYNLSGQPCIASVVSVPARGQVTALLSDWLAAAGGTATHTKGSLVLSFTAPHPTCIGAQLSMVKPTQSLAFDVHAENVGGGFDSSSLSGIWWLRGTTSQFSLVLTNTSGTTVSATTTFTAQGGSTVTQTYALSAHQTRVIDPNAIGAPTILSSTSVGTVRLGAIAISQTGTPGTVIAYGMLSASGGFSSAAHYTDPTAAQSSTATAIHAMVGAPDLPSLSTLLSFGSVALLSNTANATIAVTPTIHFGPTVGVVQTVTLPDRYILSQQVDMLDLNAALTQAGYSGPFKNLALTLTWDGAPSALVGCVRTIDATGSYVYDIPLKDPEGAMNSYGGSYPWDISSDRECVVHIINTGSEEAALTVRIDTTAGPYIPSLLTLQPGQALAINIRLLRDSQIADPAGRVIASTATGGRFFWREFASGGLIGRLETYSPSLATAGSYSCPPDCCTSDTENVQIVPGAMSGYVGFALPITLWADVQYGCDPAPMFCNVTARGHFSTKDESVATVDNAGFDAIVQLVSPGDTGVDAWIAVQECSGPPCPECGSTHNPGCSCILNQRRDAPTAPVSSEIFMPTIAPQRGLIGTSWDIMISGQGFGNGTSDTTVTVTSGTGLSIVVMSVTEQLITARLTAAGDPATQGAHDLTVRRLASGKTATHVTVVQVPTTLSVQSVSVLPTGTSGDYGCTPSQNFGIKVKVTYEVLDQEGMVIGSDQLGAQEKVTNSVYNGIPQPDPVPNWQYIGPSRISGTSQFTSVMGRFVDAPFGGCGPVIHTYTFMQQISMLVDTRRYAVRTNNVTVQSGSAAHGNITNGSDINASR